VVFLSLQETSIQGGVCDWVKDRTLHSDKLMFFSKHFDLASGDNSIISEANAIFQ
jgi:hypothetical protein